ncbi:unnamed protein product, partial [Ectocarpus sp. 13 AM-2016]
LKASRFGDGISEFGWERVYLPNTNRNRRWYAKKPNERHCDDIPNTPHAGNGHQQSASPAVPARHHSNYCF